jgi:hypothetical protein
VASFVVSILRLAAWPVILTAIFVPLERLFAVAAMSPNLAGQLVQGRHAGPRATPDTGIAA